MVASEGKEMTIHLRPAASSDLPEMMRVWLLAEGDEVESDQPVPVGLLHLLDTGTVRVAEVDDSLAGFAVSFVRGDVTFLAQLFIDPERQSGGVGRALLQAVMPEDGTVRATISSPDPRAVGLYVRHGMAPAWPAFDLSVDVASLHQLPVSMATIQPARGGDPDLVAMDAAVNGRSRPQDHRHWIEQRGGIPFWFERHGKRAGYGYLQVGRDGQDAVLRGDSVRVGPVGVVDPADAYDCVLAAVDLAREYGSQLEMLVPGPQPVLGALLEAGWRIKDIETFMTSSRPPFVDGACYIPSGGGLF
jgi:GNAT superfamily N-acetyltransferase